MHALTRASAYKEGREDSFAVETLDSPVVTIGVKDPPRASRRSQPDPTAGIHSNLYNNAWGTNYIMWYGQDTRSRFILRA